MSDSVHSLEQQLAELTGRETEAFELAIGLAQANVLLPQLGAAVAVAENVRRQRAEVADRLRRAKEHTPLGPAHDQRTTLPAPLGHD